MEQLRPWPTSAAGVDETSRVDAPSGDYTREFALLQLLANRRGEVLSRTQIASYVWDMNFDSDTNVVEVAVRRLRAKIDDGHEQKLIHTVRGMGYVIEVGRTRLRRWSFTARLTMLFALILSRVS